MPSLVVIGPQIKERTICPPSLSLYGSKDPSLNRVNPGGGHSIVKNTGGWLDNLGSGIWLGKDILGFFKNIALDNI